MATETETWHQFTVKRRVVTETVYTVDVRADDDSEQARVLAKRRARRMAQDAFNQPEYLGAAIKSVLSINDSVTYDGRRTVTA